MYDPYNPYYPNYGHTYAPSQSLIRVNGLEGAKAYPVSPNSTVALFDANEDIMYIKNADSSGFPSIRIFTFVEQVAMPIVNDSDYITRKEFEEFKAGWSNYGKQFILGQQTDDTSSEEKHSGGTSGID